MFFVLTGLIGGLALFLYGMQITSEGLKSTFGNKLKQFLSTLSKNKLIALLTGIVLTFTIQSSTAASALLVSLVNTGIMSLSQILSILLGTSMGTTLTTQIIAFKVSDYALLIIVLGFGLKLLGKKRKQRFIGNILLGVGFIFLGMKVMSESVFPLKDHALFKETLINLEHIPLLALLASALFTGLIQSSTATMGLTISLAMQGLISLNLAVPIILGSHLGSCSTVLFAGIGASRSAKRVTLANLLFKLVGVIVFFLLTPSIIFLVQKSSVNLSRQIANAHALIIVGNALIFLPFTERFAEFLEKIIPKTEEVESLQKPKFLDSGALNTPEVAFYLASKEVLRISNAVEEMVIDIMQVFTDNDEGLLDKVSAQDMIVDNLSREITKYLTKISFETLSEEHSKEVFRLLYIVDDLEHIGDLIDKNLIPLVEKKIDHSLVFSEKGVEEIKNMHQKVYNNLRNAIGAFALQDQRMAQKVIDQKEYIDSLEITLRKTHINRLNVGIELSQKTSGVHLDLINVLKRINDHSFSIARAVVGKL
ncbi:MAG: Na/Pi cotransporter family protein [Candidatus Atribacteria bacterium]|nr:Na/Pi cotransporter family protein [Candidatus Atribacteria bacterium]MBE3127184.1 Na/Pi cotransporter family protein [Candidatus Atribacteria bacterium]